MIILSEKLLIAEGGKRFCYLHPDNEKKIVKIDKSGGKARRNGNKKEYKAYQNALKKYGKDIHQLIPHYDGLIETNFGLGLVSDNIFPQSGDPTSNQHLLVHQVRNCKTINDLSDIIDAIVKLLKILKEKNLYLRDLGFGNFVLIDGRLVYIDIVGFDDLRPEKKLLFFLPKSFFIKQTPARFKRRILRICPLDVPSSLLDKLDHVFC